MEEIMQKLETLVCAACPQVGVTGMVELPLVALSGKKSALVAAALNRHLPLKSFTVIQPGIAPDADLSKIIEFLGTTHQNVEQNSLDLPQAAAGLGYKEYFTGNFIDKLALSAEQFDSLFNVYLPCLK